MIRTLLNQYLIRLSRLLRCFLNSRLNALSWFDDGIESFLVGLELTEHVNRTVLIGTLCLETNLHLMLRVVLGCPLLIKRIEGCWTVAIPAITIAALSTDIL